MCSCVIKEAIGRALCLLHGLKFLESALSLGTLDQFDI